MHHHAVKYSKARFMSNMLRIKADPDVLITVGEALQAERIDRGWRQSDLAARAGVALRTLQNLESGKPVRTDSLIRVLRALQMLDRLGVFLAPSLQAPAPSPLEKELVTERPQRVRVNAIR
jgi:transcriptional regulator with XRE-family HTH domain